MAILPHTVDGGNGRQKFTIYCETANINYFIKAALSADTVAGVTDVQVARKGYTRRQYPGDPTPVTVDGSTAEYVVDPSRRSGAALPGRSIRLVANPGMANEESRVFTLKGRWIDFHAWLSINAKMLIHAYNSSGARYTIAEAATTP